MNLLAKDESISLSTDEEKAVKVAAKEYYSLLTEDEIAKMDLSLSDVENAYSKYALSEKVYYENLHRILNQI